jgi:hypothetical protein
MSNQSFLQSASVTGWYGPPVGSSPTVSPSGVWGPYTVIVPAVSVNPYGGGYSGSGWGAYPSTVQPSWSDAYSDMVEGIVPEILSEDELEMREAVNKWERFFGI